MYLRKDGSPVDLMVSESTLRDEHGEVSAYAHRLTLDADRRTLLQEVSASRALLDEAQAIARVGSWELDFGTNTMTWSPQLYAILGAERDDAEELRALAHRLKGSALNLGAARVAEVSLALEESGRAGCTVDAAPLLIELQASLGEAGMALESYRAG